MLEESGDGTHILAAHAGAKAGLGRPASGTGTEGAFFHSSKLQIGNLHFCSMCKLSNASDALYEKQRKMTFQKKIYCKLSSISEGKVNMILGGSLGWEHFLHIS